MIIDCHAHVASSVSIPHVFFDGWSETVASNLPRTLSERELETLKRRYYLLNSDENCDQLIAEMDAAGIDKCVLLIIDFSHHFKEQTNRLVDIYEFHRKIDERYPRRFFIFSGVDPRNGTAGVELFEYSIKELGFGGMKLYPPCGYSPATEKLDPYFELCAQYNKPVLTHIGPTTSNMPFKYTEPRDVDDAAYRHPKVNFILGHAGAQLYEAASLLAEYRPNVFLDISGFQTELSRGNLETIMRFHKKKGIVRKLLFGTDWPIHRMAGSQSKWVEAIRKMEVDSVISTRELEDLFANNFLRLVKGEV